MGRGPRAGAGYAALEIPHCAGAVPRERSRRLSRWRIGSALFREAAGRLFADRVGLLLASSARRREGWYRYETGRRDALPDPAVDALIADYRKEIGVAPRKIRDDEIVDRCILALVNEGARILDEGIAQRASDIDVVYLTGYGFPRYRGGPMLYADLLGLFNVIRRMREISAMPGADTAFWAPAALLARLAAEGKTFNG